MAEEAGVALGTVYHYFTSKEHLFAEALVPWVATLRDNVNRHPLAGDTPAERLSDVLRRTVRSFQQQPNLAKLVTTLTVSSDPFVIEIITRLDDASSAVYADALTGLDDTTIRSMVQVIDHVLAGVLRLWSAGRMHIVDVYRQLDEMVGLLLPS